MRRIANICGYTRMKGGSFIRMNELLHFLKEQPELNKQLNLQ
jgi:hypothetical protein